MLNNQQSIRRAQTLSRSQVFVEVQPLNLRKMMFYDLGMFGLVFAVVFFTSLSQRSMAFNLSVSCTLLVKVFIGMFFFNQHTNRSMRLYFICRLTIDLFIYCPLHYVFEVYTATFVISFFLGLGSLLLIELIALLLYSKSLCGKQLMESLEDVPATKITHQALNNKVIVMELNLKLAGMHLDADYKYEKLQRRYKDQEMDEEGRSKERQKEEKGKKVFKNKIDLTCKWYQEHLSKRSDKVRIPITSQGQSFQPKTSQHVVNPPRKFEDISPLYDFFYKAEANSESHSENIDERVENVQFRNNPAYEEIVRDTQVDQIRNINEGRERAYNSDMVLQPKDYQSVKKNFTAAENKQVFSEGPLDTKEIQFEIVEDEEEEKEVVRKSVGMTVENMDNMQANRMESALRPIYDNADANKNIMHNLLNISSDVPNEEMSSHKLNLRGFSSGKKSRQQENQQQQDNISNYVPSFSGNDSHSYVSGV